MSENEVGKIIECPEIEHWDLSDVYCDTDEFMQLGNESHTINED